MEKNDGGGSSSKGAGDVQEQGESSAKRIKCSIEEGAFCCDECTEPLKPPIFQCPDMRHFFCSSCFDDLWKEECTFVSDGCTAGPLARSLGMEHAVKSIFVDCHYAEHGCTDKIAYYDHAKAKHRLICPHAPCECPEPGCNFTVKRAELMDHLTAAAGHHKWPSTTFQYWVPFDLRIVEPGTHVLCCSNDGRLFLVRVQAAAEPPGFAVSLGYVEHPKPTELFQCSVSFSYSTRHRGTSTWPMIRSYGSWPPICDVLVPHKVLDGPDDAGTVLTFNISCIDDAVDEDDDLDDTSYVESDEDDNERMNVVILD